MSNSFEYICGLHAVRHALSLNSDRVLSISTESKKKYNEEVNNILQLAEKNGVHREYVSKSTLDRYMKDTHHQGVVLKIKPYSAVGMVALDKILSNQKKTLHLFLILDGIQDPQNLGACIRTANAVGVDAVIIPKDKSVGVTPVVRKVSSGGVENTLIVTATNLSRTIKTLQDAGVWVVGADAQAKESLYEVDLNIPLAIVIGSEGRGMRLNTQKHCDYLVKVPMHGAVESLNVSVVSGVFLYEALRQRRQ